MNSYTLGVLKELERGKINIEEASARLNAKPVNADAPAFNPKLPRWIRWLRLYTFTSGTVIVLFGAWIIVSTAYSNILWLIVGLPVLLLGALILSLAALFSSMHWLYVHVEQKRGHPKTIRFALPIPFGLIRAALWIAMRFNKYNSRFGSFWDDPDELLHALERELKEGRGVSVDVDDKGQRVQLCWLRSDAFRFDSSRPNDAPPSSPKVSEQKASTFHFGHSDKIDNALRKEWAGY